MFNFFSSKEWLNNRVAIITGASSGIGKATAYGLSQKGCNVVLSARNHEKLLEIEKDLSHLRTGVISISADITDVTSVERLIAKTLEHFARIDFLVCNAGEYLRCPVTKLTLSQIRQVINVNFYGTLNCIFGVLPHMLQRGKGQIVIVSSMDAKKGIPPDAAYVASKAALSGLADVMRQELKEIGIFVSTIFPGRVDTPMIAEISVPWISAKIKPEKVARAIIKALERKNAEIIVPCLGPKLLVAANTISPRFGDWLVKIFRLRGKEQKKVSETDQ
jgi:short-subunit dehydrogenase